PREARPRTPGADPPSRLERGRAGPRRASAGNGPRRRGSPMWRDSIAAAWNLVRRQCRANENRRGRLTQGNVRTSPGSEGEKEGNEDRGDDDRHQVERQAESDEVSKAVATRSDHQRVDRRGDRRGEGGGGRHRHTHEAGFG